MHAETRSATRTELTFHLSPASNRQIVSVLIIIDLIFVALYLAPTLLGYEPRMFDLDGESNFPTWYSSAKLFLLAQALTALALVQARRSRLDAAPFLFLAAVALLLSADEVALIHERLARRFETGLTGVARADLYFTTTGYWMLALGPLLAAALVGGSGWSPGG